MKQAIKCVGVWVVAGITMITSFGLVAQAPAEAESCPDLKIIFARGSGGERWETNDYLTFKSTIESKLATVEIDYQFEDLDYPAVGVGIENLGVTLGALIGGGDYYEFGESVDSGVNEIVQLVNANSCPETKYVLAGYSQGAMVVAKALHSLDAERIIYAATFGDPKIYLPEGEGLFPSACRGENLSDYRMYVPDCQAYMGLLGAYIPYEPADFSGKLGTWCNKKDIFCSSHLSISDHVGYVADDLYEDASRVIIDKIMKAFGMKNLATSPHDTAILIDSTGSMSMLIEKYKAEAMRLAQETLQSGGRVALYEYRDLDDPFAPVEHCGFEDCDLIRIENALNSIQADGGGDMAESLLSTSFLAMQEQNWKMGSTKSIVVLTDANYLSPDRNGVTLDDVVQLSKRIDPVNFYIITTDEVGDSYNELAERTDGLVITKMDEFHLLTDYILSRYDSLPRVEENETTPEKPTLRIHKALKNDDGVLVQYETTGERVIIVVNDVILGSTDEPEITIEYKNGEIPEIWLIPIGEEWRGDAVKVELSGYGLGTNDIFMIVPKTPNTGSV